MSFVNDVLGECGSVVLVFEVVVMFTVSYTEWTAGLTCVLLVACETFKLVNSIFLVFVGFWDILLLEEIS